LKQRATFRLLALLLGIAAAGVLAEGAARVYVYAIAERGKLFEPDPILGWRTIPNLDLQRRNANGDPWQIRTNPLGYRSQELRPDPAATRRVLVLGDSYVFGEGIQEADRFDTLLSARFPDWSFVNLGVMGYGTDQQLIAARPMHQDLVAGDLILLITYLNDFADLVRRQHSGRSKPWFTLDEGELIEHPPQLGLGQELRDRSYVLARLFQWFGERGERPGKDRMRYGGHLYRHLVLAETMALRERGVQVLVAHHETAAPDSLASHAATARTAIDRTCMEAQIQCLDLVPVPLGRDRGALLQRDGHWGAPANQVVAAQIGDLLSETQVR